MVILKILVIFFPGRSFLEICVFRERVMMLTYGRSREWTQVRLTYQLYKYWKFTIDSSHKGKFLGTILDEIKRNPIMTSFRNKREQAVLHRLRSGHAGLNEYLPVSI